MSEREIHLLSYLILCLFSLLCCLQRWVLEDCKKQDWCSVQLRKCTGVRLEQSKSEDPHKLWKEARLVEHHTKGETLDESMTTADSRKMFSDKMP